MKNKYLAGILSVCLLVGTLPVTIFAQQNNLSTPPRTILLEQEFEPNQADYKAEQSPENKQDSSPNEENANQSTEGHKHTEDCYISFTECTHQHTEDCYPSGDTSAEPIKCTHICTEQNGCITKIFDCPYHEENEQNEGFQIPDISDENQDENAQIDFEGHKHTDDCYISFTECTHQHTEDCYPSGDTSAEPDECTHICTEQNGCITKVLDCPYHEENEQSCICTEICTEKSVNLSCPACQNDRTLCKATAALVTNPVAQIDNTPYADLKSAVQSAKDNDRITLLTDTTITETIPIEKKLTLDLQDKTITVQISSTDTTQSAFTVSSSGHFSIVGDGDKGSITSNTSFDNRAIEGKKGSTVILDNINITNFHAKNGNGAAILLNEGVLSMDSCSIEENSAMDGGAVCAYNSDVSLTYNLFWQNKSSNPQGSFNQPWHGGGAVYLEGRSSKIKIASNHFSFNSTKDHGGAIHLDTISTATVSDNTIEDSSAFNHRVEDNKTRGGDGAGIYIRLMSDIVTIENNTIQENHAWDDGGGLCVLSLEGTLILEGNEITKNKANARGGGVSFQTSEQNRIHLNSGIISNNTASDFGGGIDYTLHSTSPLELKNVLITGNEAVRGAGIWACPNSQTIMNSTLGGAIFDNTASGSYGMIGFQITGSGDEVRYEGLDSEDKFVTNENPPNPNTTMTVSPRALGGGLMQWYQDESEKRYTPGDPEANPSLYTNTQKSFGLHGELSAEYQALAQSEAQLIIQGNKTNGRGGGIASNAPIIIGVPRADASVMVEKVWTENEHPKEIKFDLYRASTDGTERIKLDRDVVLNEANSWKAEFHNLPSQYVDSNGKVHDCTYEIEEQPIDGWEGTTETRKKGNSYYITLTNKPFDKPFDKTGNLTVSKTVSGSGANLNQNFTFTVTLDDKKIDGNYGEMIFDKGVASFKLKHGERKTATGLPAGVRYTVAESDNTGYTVNATDDIGLIESGKTALTLFHNYKGDSDKPDIPNPERPDPDKSDRPERPNKPNSDEPDRPNNPDSDKLDKEESIRPSVPDREESNSDRKPQQNNQTEQKPVPQTGDNNSFALCLGLLAISSVGMIVALPKRKK